MWYSRRSQPKMIYLCIHFGCSVVLSKQLLNKQLQPLLCWLVLLSLCRTIFLGKLDYFNCIPLNEHKCLIIINISLISVARTCDTKTFYQKTLARRHINQTKSSKALFSLPFFHNNNEFCFARILLPSYSNYEQNVCKNQRVEEKKTLCCIGETWFVIQAHTFYKTHDLTLNYDTTCACLTKLQ